ncbi:MAG: nucleotidyl transferase AbiEii/AbiGii toxin family protein [Bacteroidales bacterium]|nr:nucleotidyl transferase AbiEii/AbiGii toxin family protein [Bacteroidales bacterium]MDD3907888.1 nucleotidyl transferase AbiEii/AbiGii toxin family protein [Bacteroidales bacterium]MDD4713358.1 nucleotidyl transferase AbiEii/AbiGii toxin family protein [Bacteroidales bacterium]
MIDLQQMKGYFPAELRQNTTFQKYMIKEYIQLMILDWLSTSLYVQKVVFIGGTNLRLVKGIDRFSEDLDFDCKNLSQEDFTKMTDEILTFLQRSGLKSETRDKANDKLSAFRRIFFFPEFLFELGLSGYREERFLIKVESQDQGFDYKPTVVNIKRVGFFFPFLVPPDSILCAMKLSVLLTRQKGRDFYDAMFLLGQTEPDYNYLAVKQHIRNKEELKYTLLETVNKTDLKKKYRNFEHLLFNKANAERVLRFGDFVNEL